jgi:2-dehydropantoate 2-reductase
MGGRPRGPGILKILIMGAGALGSLLGAHLCTRYEVHLVARAAHVQAIQKQGLKISGDWQALVHPAASTTPPPHWIPHVSILAVKAHQTHAAIQQLAPALRSTSLVLTIQNGLGNLEALRKHLPQNPSLAASVVYGARLVKPGHVAATGTPRITVGGAPSDLAMAQAVAEAWTLAGLPTTAVEDIQGPLIAKCLVNSIINPLTALHGIPNGDLLKPGGVRDTLKRLALEGEALLDRLHPRPPIKDLLATVDDVARTTGENRSSMLQDVEQGRPTEIEAITGRILAMARTHGVAMPEHQALYDQVRRLTNAPAPS